ncbi:unnamed protein product [Meganyctiphanes norvegica]|uniref:Uncharacterized protein n=1 Tax=Meganyctiphanes norvegica TaxID=48144 RepID=A0AAV2QN09_MEGNR
MLSSKFILSTFSSASPEGTSATEELTFKLLLSISTFESTLISLFTSDLIFSVSNTTDIAFSSADSSECTCVTIALLSKLLSRSISRKLTLFIRSSAIDEGFAVLLINIDLCFSLNGKFSSRSFSAFSVIVGFAVVLLINIDLCFSLNAGDLSKSLFSVIVGFDVVLLINIDLCFSLNAGDSSKSLFSAVSSVIASIGVASASISISVFGVDFVAGDASKSLFSAVSSVIVGFVVVLPINIDLCFSLSAGDSSKSLVSAVSSVIASIGVASESVSISVFGVGVVVLPVSMDFCFSLSSSVSGTISAFTSTLSISSSETELELSVIGTNEFTFSIISSEGISAIASSPPKLTSRTRPVSCSALLIPSFPSSDVGFALSSRLFVSSESTSESAIDGGFAVAINIDFCFSLRSNFSRFISSGNISVICTIGNGFSGVSDSSSSTVTLTSGLLSLSIPTLCSTLIPSSRS